MTKYGMATKKDYLTSEVTSTQEAPISSTNGGLDGAMFICGKGKNDYLLIGVVPQLMKEDPKFRGWKDENNMVMSCLINPMNNDVEENFIVYETM
ncbi:hypothetical protein AAG906_016867 [Vitis piasezkii]